MTVRNQLGMLSDIAAVASLVPLAGALVLDVGCGPGDIARALFEAGRAKAGDHAFDQPMLLDLYSKPLAHLA